MSQDRAHFSWMYSLTADELRKELEKRGQDIGGTSPTLRTRLLDYEKARLRVDPSHFSAPRRALKYATPSGEPSVRPDSPNLEGTITENRDQFNQDRTRSPTRPPRIEITAPAGEIRRVTRSGSSAVDVYNIMRRWNLNFSGARGSDAEAFLIRIEEGRALIPVSDEELFKSLPFY